MYEILAFKLGIWAGYFITVLCILLAVSVKLEMLLKRHNNFLIKKKLMQEYAEFEKSKEWKFSFKNGKN